MRSAFSVSIVVGVKFLKRFRLVNLLIKGENLYAEVLNR